MKILFDVAAFPVPVFIQRTALGLADNGHEIYISGLGIHAGIKPHQNITILGRPKSIFKTFFSFIYKFFFLFITNRSALNYVLKASASHNSLYSKMREFNRWYAYYANNYDIIHIQWTGMMEKLKYLFQNKPAKTVISVRGTQLYISPRSDSHLEFSYREIFPMIDAVHSVSEDLARITQHYFSGKISVIPPAVPDYFFQIPLNNQILKNKTIQLISITRFNWVKGIPLLLRILKRLLDAGNSVHLTLITPDNPDERFIYMSRNWQIEKNISHFRGLNSSEILNHLTNQDIFISTSYSEGCSNVVLESMAAGTPVIAPDIPGMNEVIENNMNGFLYTPDNVDSAVSSINILLQMSPSDRCLLTENARNSIREKYNTKLQIARFENLYREVVNA